MPRDFDNDDDFFPNTHRDIDIDEDWADDDDDLDTLFDDDDNLTDHAYAQLAEMDRNGHFQ